MAFGTRLLVNDASTYREACLARLAVAQFRHVGVDAYLKAGKLVELFPDWADEHFPLWAYHPPRQPVPAKLRPLPTFLETPPRAGVLK